MKLSTITQWRWLASLGYPPTISLTENALNPSITVQEIFDGKVLYDYTRYFDGTRTTQVDLFGLVGLSTLNLNDKVLYLTEGVSDFLSLKAHNPNFNVLGKTKLNLSRMQKHIITQLFDSVVIIADNDDTGISKANAIATALRSRLKVSVYLPQLKDITQDLYFGEPLRIKR